MLSSKFSVGDPAYFDDDKGEVLDAQLVRRPYSLDLSWDVSVRWDNGHVGWSWESDLLTQREYDDLCGKGQ